MITPNLKIKIQYRSRKCIYCGNNIRYKKRKIMKSINISNIGKCFDHVPHHLSPGDKMNRNQLFEYTYVNGYINSCKVCYKFSNINNTEWVARYPSYKRISDSDKITLRTRSYFGKERDRKFISPILKKA